MRPRCRQAAAIGPRGPDRRGGAATRTETPRRCRYFTRVQVCDLQKILSAQPLSFSALPETLA